MIDHFPPFSLPLLFSFSLICFSPCISLYLQLFFQFKKIQFFVSSSFFLSCYFSVNSSFLLLFFCLVTSLSFLYLLFLLSNFFSQISFLFFSPRCFSPLLTLFFSLVSKVFLSHFFSVLSSFFLSSFFLSSLFPSSLFKEKEHTQNSQNVSLIGSFNDLYKDLSDL